MNVNPDILKIIEHIATHTLIRPSGLRHSLNTRHHLPFALTEYLGSLAAASLRKFL